MRERRNKKNDCRSPEEVAKLVERHQLEEHAVFDVFARAMAFRRSSDKLADALSRQSPNVLAPSWRVSEALSEFQAVAQGDISVIALVLSRPDTSD